MKKETHPPYQKVLFIDSASGHRFVCGSTLQTEARETFEGVEYPVSYLSISSSSHPLFTGSTKHVDSEGRVEKFKKRFGKKTEAATEQAAAPVAPVAKAPEKKAAPAPKEAEKKAPAAAKKAPAKAAPAKAPKKA